MSDEQTPYSPPPPEYAPAPAATSYTTDPYGMPAQTPPQQKKKPTALIIIIVVVLLGCCCLGSAVAGLVIFTSEETSISGGDGNELDPADDARLQEWLDWDPLAPASLETMPSSIDYLVFEGLGVAAPEFEFAEAVWSPGRYDPEVDWYYADAVYVRAVHPSSDTLSAAVELWLQSDEMLAEGVPFEPSEGDILTTIDAGARELLYIPQWGPDGFRLADQNEMSLWTQMGSDWPEGVVVDGAPEGDYFVVSITKWHLYAVDADYPIVSATYEIVDGAWSLYDWEYLYPDEDAGHSTT